MGRTGEVQNQRGGKWIIRGDFNMTLRREKRSGNNFSATEASEFREVIERMGMVDLSLSKGQWTWSNQKNKSRIDRFFVSSNFLMELSNVIQKTLPCPTSDHYPICLEARGIQWGPVPLWLDNKWLRKEKFCRLVENSWLKCDV